MIQSQTTKQYDLEERTFQFARDCRSFMKKLPRTVITIEDGKQLIRSSGSVAANYIEANESISKKDFLHRVKICRKEAKESHLWLRLFDLGNQIILQNTQQLLTQEALEIAKIFGSIISKCS